MDDVMEFILHLLHGWHTHSKVHYCHQQAKMCASSELIDQMNNVQQPVGHIPIYPSTVRSVTTNLYPVWLYCYCGCHRF